MSEHIGLTNSIKSNENISPNIVSIIWYGSRSRSIDTHHRSDCDLQIILKKPNLNTIHELGNILENYPNVDISILYIRDIVDSTGNIIFQSGTKGPFFMYILAEGKVLYGQNIYQPLLNKLDSSKVYESLAFTIKEYITKLRIIATRAPSDTIMFKKYSLKLMKDIIAYTKVIPLKKLAVCTYDETISFMLHNFSLSKSCANSIKKINLFEHNYSKFEMTNILYCLERIVYETLNESYSR